MKTGDTGDIRGQEHRMGKTVEARSQAVVWFDHAGQVERHPYLDRMDHFL